MTPGTTGMRTRAWSLPRIDLRLLLAVAVLAAGVVGTIAVVGQARVTEPLVVAARPIPAGHVLVAEDFTVTEARLEGVTAALAVAEADLSSLTGRTAGRPIAAGALVLTTDLGDAPVLAPGEIGVTVPLAADTVGALRRGDAVTVLATSAPGRPDSRTTVLLERATVYDVGLDAARVGLGADGGARITNVTIVVPRTMAEAIGDAVVNGRLTIALAPAEAAP